MKKTSGPPDGVPREAKRLPDGRWVVERYEDGVPHGGWAYYDDTGETVEIAYFKKGVNYKTYRYYAHGTASVDLENHSGEVVRKASAPANLARFADDLPPFPSRETTTIAFTMRDVDMAKGTFEIGDVTYYDGAGNRLSASGGVGGPPVPGAVLLKAGSDRMWRSGPSGTSGAWRYYEIDGTPAFELALERGVVAAVAAYVDGSWLRQRFLPTPAFATDTWRIEHRADGHALSLRGKDRTLAPTNTNPRELLARARTFFEPVLKTRGARLRVGPRRVDRFSYFSRKKPFAVACIAEASGGDEYVVVLEPGPYEGRVFLNFHDEGLFSVQTMDEWTKDMLPELIGKKDTVKSLVADPLRLIPLVPFSQNPIADSLEAFIFALRVELTEDWQKRLKPLAGQKWKIPTARPESWTLVAKAAPSKVRSTPSKLKAKRASTRTVKKTAAKTTAAKAKKTTAKKGEPRAGRPSAPKPHK